MKVIFCLKKYFLLFFIIFSFLTELPTRAGFIAGTLVKTSNHFLPIEQLTVGDRIICRDFNNRFIVRPITAILCKKVKCFARLKVGNDYIISDIDQLFYLFAEKRWCCVQNLKPGQKFLTCSKNFVVLEDVKVIQKENCIYVLSIKEFHNFCVSQDVVVVHNFVPVVIGLSGIFGLGSIEFIGTGVGLVSFGACVGYLFARNKRASRRDITGIEEVSLSGGAPPNNPDDECEKDNREKNQRPLSNKEARTIAKKLGYHEVKSFPCRTKGKPVFKKGNN